MDLDLDPFADLRRRVATLRRTAPIGRVTELASGGFSVDGLTDLAGLGDDLAYEEDGRTHRAEVVRLGKDGLTAIPMGPTDGLRLGLPVELVGPATVAPHDAWIGRVVDPFGEAMDDRPLPQGASRKLVAPPPSPTRRRAMGKRLHTGYGVLDTVLPLARGQRVG
ncbi:MAG: flagellum-specific ATP synthase FliI, partial [Pseudomonadota bacterium]